MPGSVIELGEKRVASRRDCKLVVLEGPSSPRRDLAMGRGWSNAEQVSENVTRRLVEAAGGPAGGPLVAVLARRAGEHGRPADAGATRAGDVSWAELRGRILGAPVRPAGPGYAAVLVVESAVPVRRRGCSMPVLRAVRSGRRAVFAQLGDAGDSRRARGRRGDARRARRRSLRCEALAAAGSALRLRPSPRPA